jgi:hypothetical protein
MAERGRAGTAALEPPSLRLESKCARQSPASPQKCMWMALFGRKRPVLDDPYFGPAHIHARGATGRASSSFQVYPRRSGSSCLPLRRVRPRSRQRSVGGYSRISTPSLRVVVRCSRATSSCERKAVPCRVASGLLIRWPRAPRSRREREPMECLLLRGCPEPLLHGLLRRRTPKLCDG